MAKKSIVYRVGFWLLLGTAYVERKRGDGEIRARTYPLRGGCRRLGRLLDATTASGGLATRSLLCEFDYAWISDLALTDQARKLRYAVVQNQYDCGNLTEDQARELLCAPLEPGGQPVYDDSAWLQVESSWSNNSTSDHKEKGQ